MEKEKLEALLIDYIDGNLTDAEKQLVEKELVNNAEAQQTHRQLKELIQAMSSASGIEPSSRLKTNFDQLLQNELAESARGKAVFFRPVFYRVAAAVALLVIGGGVGFWISKQQRQAEEFEALRKEMEKTKREMIGMLENQGSASQRVAGATVAYNDIAKPDDEIVKALVNAMNDDENTNVRIAALEALGKFHNQPHVRKALIASLSTQKDPLVQIALIRLMVEMKEKGISKELERISTDEEALPAVKDEAHAGLLKLS